MIRLLVIGLLVLAGGACLPLWWREAPPAGAVTVACAPLTSLDPLECSRADDLRLLAALREPLTRLHPTSGVVEPALARAWTCSADGCQWEFTLDPLARWSDGSVVTAAQVRDGLERHRAGSPFSDLLQGVLTVTAGTGTLGITTQRPVPDLPARLAVPVFAPRHPAEASWADPRTIIGNGPLRCTGLRLRHHLDLTPSPTYAGPHPAQAPVRLRVVADPGTALRLYLDGQIDVLPSLTSDLAEALVRAQVPGLRRTTGWGTELYRVRQGVLSPAQVAALSGAIDRTGLVRDLLHGFGTPAGGLIPGSGRSLPTTTTTPAEPWPTLDLLIPAGRPDRQRVAEHLVDAWRQRLGVTVRLVTLPPAELAARERLGRYDLSRGSLVGDTPDPLGFLSAFTSGAGMNRTGWSDPTYDRLVTEAAPAGADRRERLATAEDRLLGQGVVLPLYHYETLAIARPGITGAPASPWELVHLADLGWQK